MSSEASSSKNASAASSKLNDTPVSNSEKAGAELDEILKREAAALQRDLEVERILKAFKLNPYDILGLEYFDVTDAEVKKKYKQLSLFIHPDKATHEKAPDAFDLLKKAEGELSDKAKRLDIDSTILFARTEVLKANGNIPTTISDTDPRIARLQPPYKEQLKQKIKDLLIDEELRRRRAFKLNLVNEGLEAKRKEDEAFAKKRKAEEDSRWEDNRDKRVEGWRSFQTAGGPSKKKKKKAEVLG